MLLVSQLEHSGDPTRCGQGKLFFCMEKSNYFKKIYFCDKWYFFIARVDLYNFRMFHMKKSKIQRKIMQTNLNVWVFYWVLDWGITKIHLKYFGSWFLPHVTPCPPPPRVPFCSRFSIFKSIFIFAWQKLLKRWINQKTADKNEQVKLTPVCCSHHPNMISEFQKMFVLFIKKYSWKYSFHPVLFHNFVLSLLPPWIFWMFLVFFFTGKYRKYFSPVKLRYFGLVFLWNVPKVFFNSRIQFFWWWALGRLF